MVLINFSLVKAQSQIRFILVNSDTDTDIRVLSSGQTVYYSNISHITIRAEYIPNPERVQLMEFRINDIPFHSENVAPFALRGDNNGDYRPYDPGVSQEWQSITATASRYDELGILARGTINLFFVDSSIPNPNAPTITRFVLVNAETDQDIQVLQDGSDLHLNVLPYLNIRAEGNIPITGSVIFSVGTIKNYRTENKAPYSVYGDNNGDYDIGFIGPYESETIGNFMRTIIATPYSGPNGTGISGTPVTINLNVFYGPRSVSRQAYAYPNPATGLVNLSLDEQAEMEVYDLTGKTYFKGLSAFVDNQVINLDQIQLPNGVYFIRLTFADKSVKVLSLLKN